jgi:proteic killer suppression protein
MIKSFAHKGLEQLFTTSSKAGVQSIHATRLRLLLAMLDESRVVEDMDAPGLRLHQLKGKPRAYWSVTVQANWRMIFKFDAGDAFVVDYLDYH